VVLALLLLTVATVAAAAEAVHKARLELEAKAVAEV
jgi:hypothetical protein